MRTSRILPDGVTAGFDAALLTEPAEVALAGAVSGLPEGSAGLPLGDLLEATASAVDAAERFFEDILVNADDASVRAARQGLLASLLESARPGSTGRRSTSRSAERGRSGLHGGGPHPSGAALRRFSGPVQAIRIPRMSARTGASSCTWSPVMVTP
ncbi:hypothetical protein [Tessaracoccus coleopterorum]|uniref:hypothetical protein n=1 Tax=Tessaracoccus coleopterorum TaxID=2714950 RepID=UPI001E4094DA|nr:hypothetical protein [Tessaracoccus coleopterorum]